MNVDEGNPTRKRKAVELYDPDDKTEISSSKKIRAEPETEKKVKCLKFILSAYEKIHGIKQIQEKDPDFENINIASAIMNCIFSSFNIKRQEANGFEGNAKKKSNQTKSYTITTKGQEIPIPTEIIHKHVSDAATENGLEFKKYNPNDAQN